VAFWANNRALTGGQDGHAVLWSQFGRPIGRLGSSQNGVVRSHALAVFPLGRRALTGGEDGNVHVWTLATRAQAAQWSGHEGPISDISISADGRRAVTGSHDHIVILWDVIHGSEVRRFRMPGVDRAKGVAILPDGNVLAAGLLGHVILWEANTGAILRQAEPPFTPHEELAVPAGDGRRFLTADGDGVVRMWTAKEPQLP
jgi:WD40 repeat protein